MSNFLLLATAWGPKFGGINAFNTDFAKGLAAHLGDKRTGFLCRLQADPRRSRGSPTFAASCFVSVSNVPIDSPAYDRSWSYDVWTSFERQVPDIRELTGGLATTSSPAKPLSRGRGWRGTVTSALIMHMNYLDYQAYKSGIGDQGPERKLPKQQRTLFKGADRHFANGPLLRDALLVTWSRPTRTL